jgi:hypothetical protein
MRTLTVVCPVYDEEAVILAVHQELSRVLAGLDFRLVSRRVVEVFRRRRRPRGA